VSAVRTKSGVFPRVCLLVALCGALLPAGAAAAGTPAAPEFSLTLQDLRAMTAALPKTVQDRITGEPRAFLHLLSRVLDEPAEYLVLVDKKHLLPADAAPADLVSLSASPLAVGRADLSLRKAIMPDVLAMNAAARADGVTLLFSSAYRSYDYQKAVYEREVKTYGQQAADRESAKPGASQHQLGTAVDFGSITDAFADTKAGRWLMAHAGGYGFSLSYPRGLENVTGYRYESWHYRYITRAAVELQKGYFEDIQQHLLEFLHDNRATLEAKRLPPR
jgi:D-alanyl-D-alanine carboxypeptidase